MGIRAKVGSITAAWSTEGVLVAGDRPGFRPRCAYLLLFHLLPRPLIMFMAYCIMSSCFFYLARNLQRYMRFL